jgi:predicted PurR-regulated permease PerM
VTSEPSDAPQSSRTPSLTGPPPSPRARTIFLAVSAVAFATIIIWARAVLLPFLLAMVVGYVLFPAVRACERAKMPRWAAILLVYAVALGAMFGFSSAVVPRLFEETKKLSTELPKLTQRIRDDLLPAIDARLARFTGQSGEEEKPTPPGEQPAPIVVVPREDGSFEIRLQQDLTAYKENDDSWTVGPPRADPGGFSSERALRDAFDKAIGYAQKNSVELLAIGRDIIADVSRGIFYFFLTLMLAGYMMFTYERIYGFAREMWPEPRRPSFDRFLHRVDRGLAGVVRGQLLICLVNGVLSAILFWIFGLRYWPILSLIAAMMSIIPIFGSILSSIPAVAIGLTQSFGTALAVLLGIVAIHQLEANFLNPKIIGDQAKIHPVLIVFALLVGEHFFQITGALLAVPALAVVQAVFLHFRESVLGLPYRPSLIPGPATVPPPPPTPRDVRASASHASQPPSGDEPVQAGSAE